MIVQPTDRSIPPSPKVLLIIWAAFVMAAFTYGALILSGVLAESSFGRETPDPFMLYVCIALSLASFCVGIVFGLIRKPKEGLSADGFLTAVQTRMIIQSAGFEAIAIYGLVLHITGYAAFPSMIFVGLAIILLATLLPGILTNIERYRSMKSDEGRMA